MRPVFSEKGGEGDVPFPQAVAKARARSRVSGEV